MSQDPKLCAHCGGRKDQRNPTGACNHLYWPDNLTDEAKRANGYRPRTITIWERGTDPDPNTTQENQNADRDF